jgi:hypothetical protein
VLGSTLFGVSAWICFTYGTNFGAPEEKVNCAILLSTDSLTSPEVIIREGIASLISKCTQIMEVSASSILRSAIFVGFISANQMISATFLLILKDNKVTVFCIFPLS